MRQKILSALKDEERDLVDMYVLITVIRGYDRAGIVQRNGQGSDRFRLDIERRF